MGLGGTATSSTAPLLPSFLIYTVFPFFSTLEVEVVAQLYILLLILLLLTRLFNFNSSRKRQRKNGGRESETKNIRWLQFLHPIIYVAIFASLLNYSLRSQISKKKYIHLDLYVLFFLYYLRLEGVIN